MKERNGFGKGPFEGSRKAFQVPKIGKGIHLSGPAAPLRNEWIPRHLDQVRGAMEILRDEYENLMEEYMFMQERIMKLENDMETLRGNRKRVFRIREGPPGWKKTPSGKKKPLETDRRKW